MAINKKPLLSICIPTCNRAGFLKKNLEKIVGITQPDDVEIIIADDNSSDNTQEIVDSFSKSHKDYSVTYKRFPERQFFDRMVLNMVKLAKGDYCWLLGDDDLPANTSISKIQSVIKSNPGVSLIHLNYTRFDNILKKVTSQHMVGDIKEDRLFTNAPHFFFLPLTDSYFKFLGTNVITMSTDIINRKYWLEAANKVKDFIGHNFIHCFVIDTIICYHPKIYYVAKPQVQYLANNHRIWPNNIWQDYNHVLLSFLAQIGYSQSQIAHMQQVQSIYEKAELANKSPFTKHLIKLGRPFLSILRYTKSLLYQKS